MQSPIRITAFYKFLESDPTELQSVFQSYGEEHNMRGLVLLAKEGINGTVCATPEVINEWKALLTKHFGEIVFKDSGAGDQVFRRWHVKVREEIVSLKQDDVCPNGKHNHITPEEWNRMMEEEDVVVIDTRNTYETEIGMFENAIDPKLSTFQEFPDYVKNASIPKDKKVLMYCTGGIRCEKALLEMEKQGYEHVYQLEGGILAYLEQFPNAKFKGECFVFDHRVAVGQELEPSASYKLCPHCGDPGNVAIECARCSTHKVICKECNEDARKRTCSKDCRNKLSGLRIAHS